MLHVKSAPRKKKTRKNRKKRLTSRRGSKSSIDGDEMESICGRALKLASTDSIDSIQVRLETIFIARLFLVPSVPKFIISARFRAEIWLEFHAGRVMALRNGSLLNFRRSTKGGRRQAKKNEEWMKRQIFFQSFALEIHHGLTIVSWRVWKNLYRLLKEPFKYYVTYFFRYFTPDHLLSVRTFSELPGNPTVFRVN